MNSDEIASKTSVYCIVSAVCMGHWLVYFLWLSISCPFSCKVYSCNQDHISEVTAFLHFLMAGTGVQGGLNSSCSV